MDKPVRGKSQFKSKDHRRQKAKLFYKKQAHKDLIREGTSSNMSSYSKYPNSRGGGRRNDYKRKTLEVGMKGFLCTCNMHERDCVKETYNLLNEYYDELHGASEQTDDGGRKDDLKGQNPGPAEPQAKEEAGTGSESSDEPTAEDDIETALKKEIKSLKSTKNLSRFQSVDTRVKNLVFINTTVDDPVKLAHIILEDMYLKQELKARFLLRLIPIEMTCWVDIPVIRERAPAVLEKYFKPGYKSFQIICNIRHNSKIRSADMIKLFAELVGEVNPLNFVDLKKAEYTVLVEVIQQICCVSVVTDFVKFRKYNVHEAASALKNQEKKGDSHESSATVTTLATATDVAESVSVSMDEQTRPFGEESSLIGSSDADSKVKDDNDAKTE